MAGRLVLLLVFWALAGAFQRNGVVGSRKAQFTIISSQVGPRAGIPGFAHASAEKKPIFFPLTREKQKNTEKHTNTPKKHQKHKKKHQKNTNFFPPR